MKASLALATAVFGATLFTGAPAQAQIVGGSMPAVDVAVLATGWSAKKQILGKTVYNEDNKAVGKVEDLIIAPDRTASFVIIGAGGFVGLGRHDVAIPVAKLNYDNGKIMLTGATKDAIKAMPKFEYAKQK